MRARSIYMVITLVQTVLTSGSRVFSAHVRLRPQRASVGFEALLYSLRHGQFTDDQVWALYDAVIHKLRRSGNLPTYRGKTPFRSAGGNR